MSENIEKNDTKRIWVRFEQAYEFVYVARNFANTESKYDSWLVCFGTIRFEFKSINKCETKAKYRIDENLIHSSVVKRENFGKMFPLKFDLS